MGVAMDEKLRLVQATQEERQKHLQKQPLEIDKRFEQMSYGSRKKVFLTAAALGETHVLIADEPAGGLDASARAVLAELFRTLGKTRTVFFTSYDEGFTRACEATSICFADLARGALPHSI